MDHAVTVRFREARAELIGDGSRFGFRQRSGLKTFGEGFALKKLHLRKSISPCAVKAVWISKILHTLGWPIARACRTSGGSRLPKPVFAHFMAMRGGRLGSSLLSRAL